MSRDKWIEFLLHLAASTGFVRYVDETPEGQVTLWCILECGLHVPHNEVPGYWNSSNGDVDYRWSGEIKATQELYIRQVPKELTILSAEASESFNSRIKADMERRKLG